AWVVLRDACLDLADQVRTDVSSLREDAAADTHEHREQCAAESEALEHSGCMIVEDQQHYGRAEQAEAHCEHADDPAAAERLLEPALATATSGRRGDPHVRLGGQRHTDIADRRREDRPDKEEQCAPELHYESAVVDR